jgi:Putative Actinobacterial Holin-X, holin superfamily III
MTDAGDVPQRGSSGERPVGDLVRQLSEQLSVLVRDEIRLAQLELTRKGKKAGIGAGLLGGSGLIALYGTGCLIAGAVAALSLVLAVWAAALIVGGGLFLAAGVVGLAGRSSLRTATPPVPQEAAESIKADVKVIKERTGR